MNIVFSDHANEEIARRRLDPSQVRLVAGTPEQEAPERGIRRCCQSKGLGPGGKIYLLRVIVEDKGDERRVITAYLTSRVEKYWRAS